jgi:hypothetical protein
MSRGLLRLLLPADSPQPGAGCTLEPALMATFNPAQHSHHLSALRAQLAGPGRATSPIESFSFGNKQEDEVRLLVQLPRTALLLLLLCSPLRKHSVQGLHCLMDSSKPG